MRQVLLIVVSGLLLSGCITAAKEREVYGAIRGVGFLETDARCIAARAGRQLTIRQLRSLERAANAMEKPIREMPVGQVLDAVSDHLDAETLGVIFRLTVECARNRLEQEKSA